MTDRELPEKSDRDWLRLVRDDPDSFGERLAAMPLEEQARIAMNLPPRERMIALVHAPAPMRLVRRLSPSDFYLAVREAGPLDAEPVLSLASADQLRHLLDLESWRADRFDPERAGAWAAVLTEADESALRRWLRAADDEVLMLLLRSWARVEQIEFDDQVPVHGAGESEAGNERGFVSPDGFHRFAPTLPEHAPAVRRLAEMLFLERPERYQRLLWGAMQELPSEIEEEALRWRQSRLEETGFVPIDEAVQIYAPPARDPQPAPTPLDATDSTMLPSYLTLSGRDAFVDRALGLLDDAALISVSSQLVGLAHRILSADGTDVGDPEAHRNALVKASVYVGLGLRRYAAEDAESAASTLASTSVVQLFRAGWEPVQTLADRAGHLARHGWGSVHPRALELLDSPIRERVAGLLRPRPVYLEWTAGSEGRYREFEGPHEIEETRRALELAERVGSVLVDGLRVDLPRVLETTEARLLRLPRLSTLLLTLLAWHAARGEIRLEPLPGDVTADFLRTTASRRTAAPDAPERAMTALVRELSDRDEIDDAGAAAVEAYGSACLKELRETCGGLDPGTPIFPETVPCLLLAAPAGGVEGAGPLVE